MDDYWTDAAPPRRRNWWELDEDPDQQSPYPPVGLEGFRPDPPPAIGFDVQSPPTDPLGDFTRSWLGGPEVPPEPVREGLSIRPFDPLEDHQRNWLGGYQPEVQWLGAAQDGAREEKADPSRAVSDTPLPPSESNPWVVPAHTGALARLLSKGLSDLTVAAAPAIRKTGEAIVSGADSAIRELGSHSREMAALLAPLHAPQLLGEPAEAGNITTPLGDNYRLVEKPDGSVDISERNRGWLGTSIGETWRKLPLDARAVVHPNGTREYMADWDGLQQRIGYDKTLELMQKLPPGMGGRDNEPNDSKPPNGKPQIPIPPPDYLSRKLLAKYPDLIQRDTDQWAVDGVELTEAEQEHERACRNLQKERGQPAPESRYNGVDGIDTPFTRVPPDIGKPAATSRSDNESHNKGILGEAELAIRLRNANTSHRVGYYGNPPGVNGPDGIAFSGKFGGLMTLESKYSSEPRSITPGEMSLSPVNPSKILDRFKIAKNSGRMSDEEIDKALRSYTGGNYSACIGGTGDAHNGFYLTFRNNRPAFVQRYKP